MRYLSGVDQVDVILANNDRVTLRVGATYLKVDANQLRADKEVQAINRAPVPTPEILWHKPPVLALKALKGTTLGRLGQPSGASPSAWAAVGATVRRLHDAPLPPWPDKAVDELAERLQSGCRWLVDNNVLPAGVVDHNRNRAETALRHYPCAFVHGDLHLEHVFVDGDRVSGIIDWSEARQGDALYDVASLTLGNEDCLEHFAVGYGIDIDPHLVAAWWSYRCLVVVRWLFENGYGPPDEYPEVALLRSYR